MKQSKSTRKVVTKEDLTPVASRVLRHMIAGFLFYCSGVVAWYSKSQMHLLTRDINIGFYSKKYSIPLVEKNNLDNPTSSNLNSTTIATTATTPVICW